MQFVQERITTGQADGNANSVRPGVIDSGHGAPRVYTNPLLDFLGDSIDYY